MSVPQYDSRNRLLTLLPEEELERLLPHLERVTLPLGTSLCESGVEMHHVYFPLDAIVSLLCVLGNGTSAEIAVVGNEGIVGVSLFMGGKTTLSRAIVQSAGEAYRLDGQRLKNEFYQAAELQQHLLHYTQALMTQLSQTAICNRYHTLDQQLCRWLLLCLDRLPDTNLAMTQNLIADMLGVRRSGVTQAAGKLQQAGLIAYHRGQITVLDRPGLEERVCECYKVVKDEYDRLMDRPVVI